MGECPVILEAWRIYQDIREESTEGEMKLLVERADSYKMMSNRNHPQFKIIIIIIIISNDFI